jgi:putative transposase
MFAGLPCRQVWWSIELYPNESPHRYCRDGDTWRCPPGEEYARGFGLGYSVRSSREIDWVYQRNIQFLEDYLRDDSTSVSPAAKNLLVAHVASRPGTSLQELLAAADGGATRDDVHLMIAWGELYVDLHDSPLAQPAAVSVFASPQAAADHHQNRMIPSRSPGNTLTRQPHPGSTVNWDGRLWDILNCGQTQIVLRRTDDNSVTQLPPAVFQMLIREGHLAVTSSHQNGDNPEVLHRLSNASAEDLRQGNYRYEIVRGLLDDTTATAPIPVSSRTSRRWLAMYKKAAALYGSGYLGLLPHTHRRGNGEPKLPEATKTLMAAVIREDYETHKQKSIYASWSTLQATCRNQGLR